MNMFMPVKITYFAHGTTTDNENDIATGQAPGELSDLGIKQSKKLPKKIKNNTFSVVFCSDLKRAADSARLSFGKTHKIIKDRRLRECDFGKFTNKNFSKIEDKMHKFINKKFPEGESLKDVEERIRDFLKFLIKDHNNKHVAILAHWAPQLALEVITENKSWKTAIDEDWRKTKSWKPGWIYKVKGKQL